MSSEIFDSSCNPGISQNPSNPSFILGTLKLKSQSNPTSTSVNTDAPNYMISVKKKTVFSRHVIRCLLHRCPRCKDVQTVRRPHAFTCPVGSAASPPRRRTPRSERPGRTRWSTRFVFPCLKCEPSPVWKPFGGCVQLKSSS